MYKNESNSMKNSSRTDISRFLSLVLRHKPEVIGVTLDENGWTDINELIDKINAKRKDLISLQNILDIVSQDTKGRYTIKNGKIRAAQGHSVKLKIEFKKEVPPDVLYHGTTEKFLKPIQTQGILKMARHHVHLSHDSETALNVGKRRGNPIVLKIDSKRMYNDGFSFFLSDNNVWLTDHIPVTYILFQ